MRKKYKEKDGFKIYPLIEDPMYKQGFALFIGGNEEKLKAYILKKYDVDLIVGSAEGCHFNFTDKDGCSRRFIWIDQMNWSPREQSVLAHEILHHVFSVMQDIGIKYIKGESEEAFTHYFSRMMEITWALLAEDHPHNKRKKK